MKRLRVCDFSLGVACLFLIPAEVASAQSADRILAFHSKITVARDRTLTVNERFEIVNDTGSFDNGFHRRLWVKAAGPQRAKEGGFQSINAKVDGLDGIFQTSQNINVFDIQVSPQNNRWSHGTHETLKVCPVDATVKLHFLVEDGEITADATVRFVKAGSGLGLKFKAVRSEDQERFARMIRRLIQPV
jgi:hypothetical protein